MAIPSDSIEDASEKGANCVGGVVRGFFHRGRRLELLARDDTRQTSGLGDAEEDEACAFKQRDNAQLEQRESASEDGDRDACQAQGTNAVADEHHAFAIPAVC